MAPYSPPIAAGSLSEPAPLPPPVMADRRAIRRKSPSLAATLSFVCPGLGQLYCGKIGKGLLMIFLTMVSMILTLALVGFLLLSSLAGWSIYDAYATAEAINRQAAGEPMAG